MTADLALHARRPLWWVVLASAWALFVALCVHRFPPSVDLAAHAAQMQTLAGLLRGNAEIAGYYHVHGSIGYGLHAWMFLPITWALDGAVAARLALGLAVFAFPLSVAGLAQALGRDPRAAMLSAPLSFSVSYWYGFLPTLLALPSALFGVAALLVAVRRPGRAALVPFSAATLLATLTLLFHFIPFAALLAGFAAVALTCGRRGRAVGMAVLAVLPGLAIAASRIVTLAARVSDSPGIPSSYDFGSHLNWAFRNFRVEGWLSVAAPVALTAVCLFVAWRQRREIGRTTWALLLAFVVAYLAAPKAISGAWLVHLRLAVLVAAAAIVTPRSLPIWAMRTGLFLGLVSLAETAWFHHRFEREVDGLAELTRIAPGDPPHGYLSLEGRTVLGSRLPYLEHMGQWWTATQGGTGHHFFADADHQPVTFAPQRSLPMFVEAGGAAAFAGFGAVLVFGDGALPPPLEGWGVAAQRGRWRLLRRR